MMRNLLCLLTWIVITAAAYGQVRSADVLYTHFDSSPMRGFRVGDEVFVPLDDVSNWDWSVTTRGDLAFIKMEGLEIMTPTRMVNNKVCIPVAATVRKAGGFADWNARGDQLRITSELSSIRVQNGFIKLYSAFGVEMKAVKLDDPTRVALDIYGSEITDKTEKILDSSAKLIQVSDGLVRLTVETNNVPDLRQYNRIGRSFEAQLPLNGSKTSGTPAPRIDPNTAVRPPAPPKNYKVDGTVPQTNYTNPPVNQGSQIIPSLTPYLPVDIERDDVRGISINFPLPIALTGAAQARNPRPNVLEVVLPGIDMDLPIGFRLKSPMIESVNRSYDGAGTVLTFNFARPLSSELWMDGKIVRLTIKKPLKSGNLAGMTIVVDPGHGGGDTGTTANGVKEKDLNLIMGKLIADKLAAEGANVILTRKTDVFIPLGDRAKMANSSDADLFISSHINSTAKGGGQSGTIIFHHKGNEVGKFLAECIMDEVGKVNGLPDLGAWSDGRIYQSGFSVLRNTKMPGVLLELGFINNATDRNRMITADFQDKVAAAVVKGIKVYLANGS